MKLMVLIELVETALGDDGERKGNTRKPQSGWIFIGGAEAELDKGQRLITGKVMRRITRFTSTLMC